MTTLQFPDGFAWGVATSAYQIEGAAAVDGRGASIWDWFSHTAGRTEDGATGDVACDHYHRYGDDVALMANLGVQAYRFSVSWPRILPDGRGRVNEKGLDYYGRLLSTLLEANITPYLTLNHWELPLTLFEKGGWPNRETVDAFLELADLVSRRFGDRVTNWITHNEPWCESMLSYQMGIHAPGEKDNWLGALQTAHHLLLSHGHAVAAIRANVPEARVGIALNFEPAVPASRSGADVDAARIWDGYYHRWFLDPLYGRFYPADMVDHYTRQGYLPDGLSYVQDGDMATIATPTDFLGVNNYTRHVARAEDAVDNLPQTVLPQSSEEQTAMGWDVSPDTFYQLLNRLHFEYQIPDIVVTENGCSYLDDPDEDGRVRDDRRIAFLVGHLTAVYRAIQNGVPITGYLQWSFMDNFEWARGYNQRFGIVYVDYETQKRYPKDSAFWYRDVIGNNGF